MTIDVITALRAVPGAAAVLDALSGRDDVWIVGGAVRDTLLGVAPRDLDLVVEGPAAALAAELGEIVAVHERFDTAETLVGELAVGVARARVERYERPGALPQVEPASLQDDLGRRDFSVNAVAVSLDGRLHGADGWQDDLSAGRLRVLHELSFADDPTRLWRAARYAARLGFGLERGTELLARAAVAAGALDTVTGPRLGSELELALHEPDPAATLWAALDLGLLPMGACVRRALVRDALALGGDDVDAGVVALAAACSGVDRQRLRAWLDELAVPARERDVVVATVVDADALAAALAAATRPSQIAAAARGLALEAVAIAGAIGGADAARSWLQELRHVRLSIDGGDLLAAGIAPGPDLGRRLERALAAKLDGQTDGDGDELAAALA